MLKNLWFIPGKMRLESIQRALGLCVNMQSLEILLAFGGSVVLGGTFGVKNLVFSLTRHCPLDIHSGRLVIALTPFCRSCLEDKVESSFSQLP